MEYVIIGACIVVAIAGGIVLYVKNKRTKNELGNTAVVVSKTSSSKLQASEVANDPVIQIGILPADAISDETKLVEITDSTEALTDVESPEINALKNYLTLSFKKDKMAFIEENPFVAWSAMVSNKDGTYGRPCL